MTIAALGLETAAEWAAAALVVAAAALVHGTLGVGFPMVATPLLALMTDVRSAVLLLVVPTVVLNITNICVGGRWKQSIGRYWPLAVYGTAGSVLGTHLLIVMDPRPFKLLLAAMLLLYLNTGRLNIRMAWVRRRPQLAFAVFGLSAGVLGGTVNVMLPALVILALELKLEKTVTVQVFNFCFLFGKLAQGAVFAAQGRLVQEVATPALGFALLALVVATAGIWLRSRIETETYHTWLRFLLLVISVLLVVQYTAA